MRQALTEKRNLYLHLLMAFIGGGTGIYAVVMRGRFGQAQTVNLISLVEHWISGDSIFEVLSRLGAFLVFLAALSCAHLLNRSVKKESAELICLLSGFVMVVMEGLLPESTPQVPALYPLFWMSGFQWGIFTGAEGFACSTIFCTNNSKMALYGWMDYLHDRSEKSLRQARFFTATLAAFYLAAFLFGILNMHFGIRSIWFEALPLGAALLIWLIA